MLRMGCLLWMLFVGGVLPVQALPAFPGAEGFGTDTPGGRGGKVFVVTSLEDTGPGTLREACEAEGPRMVVFTVGGNITLKGDLKIRHPFITIAGQTAPGGGICLKDYCLNIKDTHDVVIRHLRVRPGDVAGKELDGITVSDCTRVVLDHLSVSWGIDETLSVTDSSDCTVQWCIISESLNDSLHKKGEHGYGSLISGNGGGQSWHHNLYAHHKSRSPRVGADAGAAGVITDFRNNVIYDWIIRSGYSGDAPVRMNYIANYLRPGPSTPRKTSAHAFWSGGVKTQIYFEQNRHEGAPHGARRDQSQLLNAGESFPEDQNLAVSIASVPFEAPAIHATSADSALDLVLLGAGATRPARDAVDERVVAQVRKKKGQVINSQREVNGWPALARGTAPTDADRDGMPDAWESAHGLNPNDPSDHVRDTDGNGYTAIEDYANGLAGALLKDR